MGPLGAHAAPPASMADGGIARALNYGTQCLAVAAAKMQKLRHDPLELVTRAAQPVLWLIDHFLRRNPAQISYRHR